MQQQAQVSATVIKQEGDAIASLIYTIKESLTTYNALLLISVSLVILLLLLILRKRHGNK